MPFDTENKYTIVLADGTEITDLTLNGNNFVSQTEITEDIFEGNMAPVIIKHGDVEEVHIYMDLVQIQTYGESMPGWYFILRDVTPDELERGKVRSDIDYLYMMTGIDS